MCNERGRGVACYAIYQIKGHEEIYKLIADQLRCYRCCFDHIDFSNKISKFTVFRLYQFDYRFYRYMTITNRFLELNNLKKKFSNFNFTSIKFQKFDFYNFLIVFLNSLKFYKHLFLRLLRSRNRLVTVIYR